MLQASDTLEHVATEHFWMSGLYWGLCAMAIMGRLQEMDTMAIGDWVLQAHHDDGGWGGSPRNDSHILYTLSALQVLAWCSCRFVLFGSTLNLALYV
jgi:geranylgeranyl transferase type-2 subunit beta